MSILLQKLNLICRCGGIYRTNRLADVDMPSIYHGFVFLICRYPGMSQDALTRRLCMNKSTVTRRLAHLEENGYITRVPSEVDKRVMLVHPTEKMQAVLPRVREATGEWNTAVTEDIPTEDMAIFYDVLDRIAVNARALSGIEDTSEMGGDA